MHKNSGFTMVELMITVIIIGILVSMAIPNYARSLERSKCSQAIQILKNMRNAGLSYYANNETFPTPGQETDLEDEVGANFYSDDSNADWDFSITTGNNTTFVVQASRRRGPHPFGSTITITDNPSANQNEVWGGTYPRLTPTVW
ncbi:MAG: type II secretion system protein [Candidatus Omnitrophota bacterium]